MFGKIFKRAKKVGLVLGGGGGRGVAHIGVLKVLVENKIPIHFIAGTSSGAIFGALFSGGMNPYDMAKEAHRTDWLKLVKIKLSWSGPVTGEGIERLIKDNIGDKNIEDLRIPLRIIASDLKTGEKVVISKGNIAKAAHASAAIPGIFSPVQFEGRLLADGLIVDNVPVSTAKDMGADFVIAVDVVPDVKLDDWTPNIFEVIERAMDISCRRVAAYGKKDADIVIDPVNKNMVNITAFSFNDVNELIKMGEDATNKIMPQLKKKLGIN
jgi:NTE family protein